MFSKTVRNILWFILISAVTGIGGIAGKEIAKDYIQSDRKKDVLDALRKKSSEMNSGFPKIIDKETRIDTTMVESDPPSITYYYTLINYDSTDVHWPSFSESVWPKLKANYCGSMEELIKEWVHVGYSYKGKDDVPLGTINLSPIDCMKHKRS